MDGELAALFSAAASIGFFHTVLGPDHYVPFIAMARARAWTPARTLIVTAVCGVGHVVGSIVLGATGIALGWALGGLQAVEAVRGDVAGWLLFGFGLAYLIWGARQLSRNRPHSHWHHHGDGRFHDHTHQHRGEHSHVHQAGSRVATPWMLFVIFVFGPCEPLIPILMYPASRGSVWGVVTVTAVFALVTIVTMTAMVALGVSGLARTGWGHMERYGHVLAGGILSACGVAVLLGI